MSTVQFLSARDNLLDAVLACLQPEGDDYSSTAVLFQGKRPAHFLRKALALRRGSACVPPSIFSLDSFVNHCYGSLLNLDGRDIAQLDAIGILFEEHRAMENRLGGENFVRLETFFPLGLRLLEALEELRLHNTGSPLLRAAMPLSDFPAGDRLSVFYETFYRELERERLVTHAMKAAAVAERIGEVPPETFRRIIIAGFFAFAPVEQTIIARLREWDQATFFFQEGPGLKRRIEGLGFTAPSETASPVMPEIHYIRAQGTHGEILGLNRILVDPETAPPMDERTVVVLPSADALFPVTEWTLPLIPGGNFNVSLGYPARRTPTFGFLENLMRLVASRDGERISAPDYVRFILHPYTKNLFFNGQTEVTRIMFHAVHDTLATVPGGAFISLEQLETDNTLHEQVSGEAGIFDPSVTAEGVRLHLKAIHDRCLRSLMQARSLGEYAAELENILTYVDDNSPARRHSQFRRFGTGIMEALEAIRLSRLAPHHDSEGSSYGSLILRWLQQVSVPFTGTPVQGVQVLGLLETRNLQFENVFVLDVNDDVLPGSPDVDPLLPPAVRAALHLPHTMERQEAIRHYFMILLGGAKKVYLFYQEGADVRRSRFVERMIWEEERNRGVLSAVDPAVPVQLELSATNRRPSPIRKNAEDLAALRSLTYTATALDSYLRCSLQFYYGHVLRLRERRGVEPGIDALDIGRLLHEVLRDLDLSRCGKQLSPQEEPTAALHTALDETFSRHFGPAPQVPLLLMKGQMEKQLGKYVTWYGTDILAKNAVFLEGLEVSLRGEFSGAQLRGRADRIERRGGRTVIIDYKKGGDSGPYRTDVDRLDPENAETWRPALQSVQLPLYLLMKASSPSDIPMIDPVYVFLGATNATEFEYPLFGEGTDRAGAWKIITATLSNILREIRDPEKDFQAPADLDPVCPHCPYRAICGTGWVRSKGAP